MKYKQLLSNLTMVLAFCLTGQVVAQTTVTIGTGTSSSSTRGPFQRADTNSSTVFSRWHMVYTASELSAAGITNGVSIQELQWDLASSNVIVGSGNANLKIYVKNSSATSASTGAWTALTTGSTKVFDTNYNTTNNFPGANGWMPFSFTSPFVYTGGALEISVDWDCSQVSTPAFSGNGALKFRWSSTAPTDLVVKKTGSSSAPSTISDLKDERANIQIVYSTSASCPEPASIGAIANTQDAHLMWLNAVGASGYNWRVVASGAGSGATAVDSGMTTSNKDTAMGLMPLTTYDLFVQTDCGSGASSNFAGPYSFMTQPNYAAIETIGMGTSSSSTRGPFQRSDTASSTVFSRFVHIYTASELAATGIMNGDTITALNWDLASSNIIVGAGSAAFKVFVKNSSATSATADTWANIISGSSMVVDNEYNTAFNFPGVNGWMSFNFNQPFIYSGGALEIAVDWDCSQVSSPAFSGDGAIKWSWESTAPDDLVVKKTSSSSPSSTISDLKDERANIQIVHTAIPPTCAAPTGLDTSNVTMTSADLSWMAVSNASAYSWKVVVAGAGSGATAVDSGSVMGTSVMATGLSKGTGYEFYVMTDCGSDGMSTYSSAFSFTSDDNINVEENDLFKKLVIAPNPSNGIVRIELDLEHNANVEVAIYNTNGALISEVFSGNVNSLNQMLDLSLYKEGLYLIRFLVDGEISSKRLILIK